MDLEPAVVDHASDQRLALPGSTVPELVPLDDYAGA